MEDDERRSTMRAPTRKLACVTAPDGHTGMYEVIDLSPGGLRLKGIDYHVSEADMISIEIEVEDISIEADGRVVHADEHEAGVQFVDLSDKDSAHIEVLILEHGWS